MRSKTILGAFLVTALAFAVVTARAAEPRPEPEKMKKLTFQQTKLHFLGYPANKQA